jgi:hypothetical protein
MLVRLFGLVLVLVLVLVLALLAGCEAPDLGEAPVYCNVYEPRCPEGYSCEQRGEGEVCVRGPGGTDGGTDGM